MLQHTNILPVLAGLTRKSVLASCGVCTVAEGQGQPESGNDSEGMKMDEIEEDF